MLFIILSSSFKKGNLLLILFICIKLSLSSQESGSDMAMGKTEIGPGNQNYYQECTQNSDCPEKFCCLQGMMRFQMPFCSPLGRSSEPCHPTGENFRENYTLSFPNMDVEIKDSYSWICPCDQSLGFTCNRDAICVKT